MEINEENLNSLEGYLRQSTSHQNDVRKNAEAVLLSMESKKQFPLLVLRIIDSPRDQVVKSSAAILFKNMIKRNWREEKIDPNDCVVIKQNIVTMIINTPSAIQKQLSEALTIIAEYDFPEKWDTLIPELVSKIDLTNPVIVNGILQSIHSICKRYRYLTKTNEVMLGLKYILDNFSSPFMQILSAIHSMVAQANTKQALELQLNNLLLCIKIFYSLSYIDLSEFFEDNLINFMPLFNEYLKYDNPLVRTDDDDAPGVLETTKSSICEIAELYTRMYGEEFAPFLPEFVKSIWSLLTNTGLESKNDVLVSTAIKFLSSVARLPTYKNLFEAPETLKSICERIIVPNMQFRDSDEDFYQDSPMDYVRKEIEGSDFESRRKASTDLVRSLCVFYEREVTNTILASISALIASFGGNNNNWKSKDTAIALMIAVSVKSTVASIGATSINPLANVGEFFQVQILPSLQLDNSSPYLKSGAIKFLYTFRSQIPRAGLHTVLPNLVALLGHGDYVVRTYSAACIERILFIKDKSAIGQPNLLTPDDLAPHLAPLLTNLFAILNQNKAPEKVSENEFVMKCLMRVIVCSKNNMSQFISPTLAGLTEIMSIISKNPSNPRFNHFLFESVSALIRSVPSTDTNSARALESMVFPPLHTILQENILDFMPYVFQILSQLLELHPVGSLSGAYKSLFPALTQSTLWEHGNIPPLSRLVSAYLTKSPQYVVEANCTEPILGIFQKLVSSKVYDQDGFAILNTFVKNMPRQIVDKYLQNVIMILLQRNQASKTAKFSKELCIFFSTFSGLVESGAAKLTEVFETINPGLSKIAITNVMIPEIQKISNKVDKKICAIGMTNMITCIGPQNLDVLAPAVLSMVKLFELPEEEETAQDEIELTNEEFQTEYVKLSLSQHVKNDPLPNIIDVRIFFAQSLAKYSATIPGRVRPLIEGLGPEVFEKITSYFVMAGVSLM